MAVCLEMSAAATGVGTGVPAVHCALCAVTAPRTAAMAAVESSESVLFVCGTAICHEAAAMRTPHARNCTHAHSPPRGRPALRTDEPTGAWTQRVAPL